MLEAALGEGCTSFDMNLRHLSIFLSWTIICILPALQAQDLNDGLVAYYPFNDNADDESGNGNDGTAEGSFEFTPDGREGNAVRLNGDGSLFYSGGGFVDLPIFDSTLNMASRSASGQGTSPSVQIRWDRRTTFRLAS